ncbi:MAG: 2-hydroxyacyl-CoA dehydratase family protein [Synergistaceae bacterium]|nr:2-hydroxyacyl-CoA dehydratase family protein [Synergistaceae bacterium]
MSMTNENRDIAVALEPFRETNRTFPRTSIIEEYKRQGGKIFGWLCTYVPEELIHAAGALPIRITGYSREMELEDGTAYLYSNSCSFSRSCLQLGLQGDYDILDGVVGGSTCDGARRLFDVWRQYVKTPFNQVLTVPRKFNERAHDLYYDQVVLFKENLERFLQVTITDEALLKSIGVFNEFRSLLKQLYEYRKRDVPPVSGAETMEVLNASFRMPKEQFNLHLRNLLSVLPENGIGMKSRARVLVIGSILTNPDFLNHIEEQGALVVADELCTSTRYWSDPIVLEEDVPPLKSVARRYLNNFPCARMVPSDERFNRIMALAKDFRADGVISQTIRYCVPYAHDLPLLGAELKKHGLPMLTLDVEYGTSGSGQVQTRVQAFLEMLEAKVR